MFTPLTQKLDAILNLGTPGFDFILCHKGKCIFRHNNGFSDREAQIPMQGTERYNLYSCSKPITCTAALQLYEKGLFQLSDPLGKYLPEFETMYVRTPDGLRPAQHPITIHNLFTMTAGFSYDLHSPMIEQCRRDTDNRCPTRELVRYLAKESLCFEPGAKYQYSLCHDVLAALVEELSGMRFGEYVRRNIFEPLGMTHSTYLLPEDRLDMLAAQYTFLPDTGETVLRPKTNDYRLGSCYESGGAGCVSTVEDYILFLEGLRRGELLRPETLDLMSTNQLTEEQMKTFVLPPYGYGLGVRCSKGNDGITDFGWDGAAGSYLAIDRAHEMTLFYAQHVLCSPVPQLHRDLLLTAQEIIEKNF